MIISVIYNIYILYLSLSFFESTCKAALRDKRQCHQAQVGLSVATMYTYPALDLSVTNVPASDVYRLPPDLCFAKPGHDDDDGMWIYY